MRSSRKWVVGGLFFMKLTTISLALLSIPLVACSNDPLEPGEGSDPGAGTNTLLVEGNASAEARVPNAKLASDFTTDFSVRVQLNGQDVTTGATVTVQSLNVNVTLTFSPDNGGRWIGTAAGYDESYRLDVISGADKVTGVIVDGPTIHTFTAPMQGASLDSTLAIPVTWDRGEEAQNATIKTENIDRLTIPDSGTYMLPPNALKAEKDKTKENTIELRRSNRVVPAGAVGGSSFSVSVENDLDVIALANPAL
jgi:hypothetical protein